MEVPGFWNMVGGFCVLWSIFVVIYPLLHHFQQKLFRFLQQPNSQRDFQRIDPTVKHAIQNKRPANKTHKRIPKKATFAALRQYKKQEQKATYKAARPYPNINFS